MGIKEAAGVAGVHYVTLYEWLRRYEVMGEEPASLERGGQKDKHPTGESDAFNSASIPLLDQDR